MGKREKRKQRMEKTGALNNLTMTRVSRNDISGGIKRNEKPTNTRRRSISVGLFFVPAGRCGEKKEKRGKYTTLDNDKDGTIKCYHAKRLKTSVECGTWSS